MGLDKEGVRLGLDKSSLHHNYLSEMELAIGPLRSTAGRVVEIASFPAAGDLWASFFAEAAVLLIMPHRMKAEACDLTYPDRVTVEFVDFDDPVAVAKIAAAYPADVVVDDGDHRSAQQLTCFKSFFSVLRSGGLYIVEDLHTYFPPIDAFYFDRSREGLHERIEQCSRQLAAGLPTDPPFINSIQIASKLVILKKTKTITFGMCSATERWSCQHLDNGGDYSRTAPVLIDAPGYICQGVEQMIAEGTVEAPAARVSIFQNAIVFGRGYVICDDFVVTESLFNMIGQPAIENWTSLYPNAGGDLVGLHGSFEPRRVIDEPAVLIKQNGDENYGHWLIEGLPRLALIEELGLLEGHRIVLNGDSSPTMQSIMGEALGLLGIGKEQLLYLDSQTTKFSKLVYPHPLTIHPYVKAPRVLHFLRSLALKVLDETEPRKIYISRNQWNGARQLSNEVEIIEFVKGEGYTVVHPETLNFVGQMKRFANASHVIGTLGGSLSNLVFCPDKVDLLALTTPLMNDDFFWDIVSQKGGLYISLHGQAANPEKGMQSDFKVDMRQFVDAFKLHSF